LIENRDFLHDPANRADLVRILPCSLSERRVQWGHGGVVEPLPEICSLIDRHAGPGKIASAQTDISGLKVTAARVTTEPVEHVYEPVFGLVAQGSKSIVLGDKVFDYGSGHYLVVSVDLPITSQKLPHTSRIVERRYWPHHFGELFPNENHARAGHL
jgi:hypothetical protein